MGIKDAKTDDFLREFLSDADVPCPACGYNLRGLAGARCPECGEAIALQVGLVDPKIAANITGLIGLAAGTGLNGLLLLFATIRIVVFNDRLGGLERFLVITGCGFAVLGIEMWIWLRSWRRIRRLTVERRWLLAAIGWGMALADIVIFSVMLK